MNAPILRSPRNIVLCFDGTDNYLDQLEDGLQADTNVEIFYNALRNVGDQQVKYVAGIGWNPNSHSQKTDKTPVETSITENKQEAGFSLLGEINNIVEFSKKSFQGLKRMLSEPDVDVDNDLLQRFNQLKESVIDKLPKFNRFEKLTGTGISERIRIGYKWLAQTYQPNDRIYLFGFSRGAYTARSLASLVSLYGLPPAEEVTDDLVDTIYRQYRDSKKSYTDPAHSPDPIIYTIPSIHFLGVWDTVGALGQSIFGMQFNVERFDNSFHDVNLRDNILYAYHALAMDDIRSPFLPTLFYRPENWKGVDLEQTWFRGAHSDIGGGYGDRRLANISLHWMVEKARAAGLQFNDGILLNYPIAFDQLKMHDEYQGYIMKAGVSWPRWVPTTTSKTDPSYNPSMGYLHPSVLELSQYYSDAPEWKITELPNVGDSVEVSIDSRKEWNPTGIILHQGNTYRIQARGKVFDASRETDAGGWYEDNFIYRNFPRRIQEANWMELCGTVAIQPQIRELNRDLLEWIKIAVVEDPIEFRKLVFRVGREKSIIVKQSGFLWLFLNDNWITYGNNTGKMSVTITRES